MKTYTITEEELEVLQSTEDYSDLDKVYQAVKARAEAHVLPIQGTQLGYVHHMEEGDDYHNHPDGRRFDIVTEPDDANVITSKLLVQPASGAQLHQIVLDVDYPVHAIPSTTPGHSHLYIEKALTWAEYKDLLEVLSGLGIVQEGYYRASEREGFTSVRLPWVKKEPVDPEVEKLVEGI